MQARAATSPSPPLLPGPTRTVTGTPIRGASSWRMRRAMLSPAFSISASLETPSASELSSMRRIWSAVTIFISVFNALSAQFILSLAQIALQLPAQPHPSILPPPRRCPPPHARAPTVGVAVAQVGFVFGLEVARLAVVLLQAGQGHSVALDFVAGRA